MLDKPGAFVLLEKFLQPSEASVMPTSPGSQLGGFLNTDVMPV